MSIIMWIIFGGLAGWIASMITGNNASQGILGNIIVGIIGAVIGGFIMNMLGQGGVNNFGIYDFLVAIGGATLLLAIMNSFRSRHHA